MTYALVPVRTLAPSGYPVTVDEARRHLRVDHPDDDGLIDGLIAVATARLDGWSGILGRCLLTQTWAQSGTWCPWRGRVDLPLAPLFGDVVVTYRDADNIEQTLDAATYHAVTDHLGSALLLASGATWPATYDRPDALTVTASYGYGAAADVPAPIRAAVLLMVGDLYANRETAAAGQMAAVPMSTTVDALLAPYRRPPL